jgi:hypothetical protein
MPSPSRRLALIAAGLTAALTVAAIPAHAAPSVATTTDPGAAAAGWLAQRFVDASHKPSPKGDHFEFHFGGTYSFDGGTTADAIFGLAAAKAGEARIDAAIAYLAEHVDEYADLGKAQGGPYDGSIAKAALAAIVAGADPHHFGGHDLLQALKDDECPARSTTCAPGSPTNIFSSVSESLVIIAESRAGGAFAPDPEAVQYFLSLQCPDGGFTGTLGACTSGVDETAFGTMALAVLGGHDNDLTKALNWLAGKRSSNGSWNANTNSTGVATAALAAAGQDVSTSRTWLAGQQVTTGVTVGPTATRGALKYQGQANLLATDQGLLGLAANGSLATLSAAGASIDAPVLAPTASLSRRSVGQGGKLTVTGIGFGAAERVQATVRSSPVNVATATAADDGTAEVSFAVPASLPAGQHAVELAGLSSGLTVSVPFAVTAPPVAAPSVPATGRPASAASSRAIPQLAATGTPALGMVLGGLVLLGLGGAAVVFGRRRT